MSSRGNDAKTRALLQAQRDRNQEIVDLEQAVADRQHAIIDQDQAALDHQQEGMALARALALSARHAAPTGDFRASGAGVAGSRSRRIVT